MGEMKSSPKTSDASCNSSLMLVAFRLGYLQATCNQILAKVAAMQPMSTEPPRSGRMKLLSKLRAWASDFLLLHKLFVAWRAVSIPAAGYTAARWLGLL
jgi:hypothetical protein